MQLTILKLHIVIIMPGVVSIGFFKKTNFRLQSMKSTNYEKVCKYHIKALQSLTSGGDFFIFVKKRTKLKSSLSDTYKLVLNYLISNQS